MRAPTYWVAYVALVFLALEGCSGAVGGTPCTLPVRTQGPRCAEPLAQYAGVWADGTRREAFFLDGCILVQPFHSSVMLDPRVCDLDSDIIQVAARVVTVSPDEFSVSVCGRVRRFTLRATELVSEDGVVWYRVADPGMTCLERDLAWGVYSRELDRFHRFGPRHQDGPNTAGR